jgi:phosphatidylserine/phosphatidylglycerophosphate/cardiolipin synthase-like enzyme
MAAAAPPLAGLGPLFSVAASRVRPLASPPAFAAALLAGVRASQRRVTLAALYLGVGAPEQRLVRALRLQCARQPRLQVAVQLDLSRALRASAPPQSAGVAAAAFASPAHHLLELFRPLDAREAADEVDGIDGAYGSGGGGGSSGSGGGGDKWSRGATLASRVHVGLTLLPQLRAFPVSRVPPRWVESAGVFHAKAFVFDRHTVLLSGANLSEDYFTTRQDRYVLVGGDGGGDGGGVGALAEYLHGLVDDLRNLPGGHTLRPDGVVAVNAPRKSSPPPKTNTAAAAAAAGAAAAAAAAAMTTTPMVVAVAPALRDSSAALALAAPKALLRPQLGAQAVPLVADKASPPLDEAYAEGLRRVLDARSFRGPPLSPGHAAEGMCLVAPRLQLGLLGVRHDEHATLALLRGLRAWPQEECHIATGYFNLTRAYADSIVATSPSSASAPAAGSRIRLLTAAPAANGFFGARGISGAVPAAYAELARRFWELCAARGRVAEPGCRSGGGGGGGGGSGGGGGGVSLHEYELKGWTFHAKGLWLGPPPVAATGAAGGGGVGGGMVSLVGSPNFGRRSTERDLELQFAFATRDAALSARLRGEQEALWDAAHVTEVCRDTRLRDDRRIEGMSWRRGRWIHAFLAVFAALF